jgi:UDP-N-acetylmuramoyl-L-alanyl-D-glutamate--2,6-diaminopimelate ligase
MSRGRAMSAPVRLADVARVLRAADLLVEGRGPGDPAVLGVSQDSRTVRPGELFLAWQGAQSDAHAFVAAAAAAGAVAAVVERPVPGAAIPQLVVRDGRVAAALAASSVLGDPGRELFLVAVTGTNGKTTTALLARHLLARRAPAAALGTLGLVRPDGTVRPGTEGLTTPGPVQLSTWLRDLADEGVGSVVMEASSHALAQHRLDALRFDVAVFTNLTQDHLDFHGDLAGYFRAKARLVEMLESDGTLVINRDDRAWDRLSWAGRTLTFSVEREADLRARDVELGAAGSTFRLEAPGGAARVTLPLLGRFNVENALGAAAAALVAGLPLADVAAGLSDAPQVPGRLERVTAQPVPVLIDFAHTPDALAGVLGTLRPLVTGRLIVVFGAGGDRDRGKRRPMAEAVARTADVAILTSDNPRTEDPERILDDLEPGLAGIDYQRIADRRAAIARALELATSGDLVLLAGKGHETYQLVGTEKRPFDERAVVRELLGAA